MAKLLAILRTPSLGKKVEQCRNLPRDVAVKLLPAKVRIRLQSFVGKIRPRTSQGQKQQITNSQPSDEPPAQSIDEGERESQSHKLKLATSPTDTAALPAKIDELEGSPLVDQASRLSSILPCFESPVAIQNDEGDAEELVWGAVRKIEDNALINLAQNYLGTKYGDTCKVVERKEGSYNRVHIVRFSGEKGFKCVIKVPACGRPGIWRSEDAIVHRSQALTINYIKRHTLLPVPEVLAYDHTCDNAFRHPFIIETFLEGRQIFEVWNEDYSLALEGERLRILRSLAMTMKEFDRFPFDAAGTLYYEHDLDDNPKVGPQYAIHELVDQFPRLIPSYNNTHQHFEELLNAWWDDIPKSLSDSVRYSMRGVFKMMKLAVQCIPHNESDEDEDGESESGGDFDSENDSKSEIDLGEDGDERKEDDKDQAEGLEESQIGQHEKTQAKGSLIPQPCIEMQDPPAPETFVLAPPDFNWQNILIDEECNITGLLDWDRVSTVPRLLGFAKTPLWLNSDWLPGHQWSGKEGETDHDLERYRKAYASHMAEAMEGTGDCIYTGKSHLFDSLRLALDDCQDTRHYVCGWLRVILPRSDAQGYLERIGNPEEGFEGGEADWMRERLGELFECFAGPDEQFSF